MPAPRCRAATGPAAARPKEGWTEPGVIGRLEKGQAVIARDVKEVAASIYWAEVEPNA